MSERVPPDPRPDGLCSACEKKRAVTTDKRFCRPCLKKFVADMTPIPTGPYRGFDSRQERTYEPNPWQENAVREMEDKS